jgi:hypothetical protein
MGTCLLPACSFASASAQPLDEVSTPIQPAPVLPADLVTLEQKMEHLQVRTERFSERSQGSVKLTSEANGKPVGRSRYVSLDGSESGVASLSPSASKVSIRDSAGRTEEIVVGSTLYVRSPTAQKLARLDGGRPWIRSHSSGGVSLPFHGRPEEVSFGGSGPYANLVNLLATAVGEVVQLGPVLVSGQQTTEFEASIDPLRLVTGLTQEDVTNLKRRPPSYHLTVCLTESGVPVRVVTSLRTPPGDNTISSSSTTEILALEVPVGIKAPPARRTISEARFNKLSVK